MTRFTALLLASLALTGCGKAPSTAAKIASTETERVVTYAPHAASATTTDKVGVYVDGRWYVKGEEPTAKADTAIEAPASGMGNLHVTVSLAGVTDFTGSIKLIARSINGTEAGVASLTKGDLRGQSTDAVLKNVAPGEYALVKQAFSTNGSLISETSHPVEVKQDATIENSI